MSEEQKPVEAEKEPVTPPGTPQIGDMGALLTQAVLTGNPNAILELLPLPPAQKEALKAQMAEEQRKQMILASQVGSNTDALMVMAKAMDNWRDGVRNDLIFIMRKLDLMERVWRKVAPGIAEELERLEIDRQNRAEVAAKAKAGSAGSKQVTTPKP